MDEKTTLADLKNATLEMCRCRGWGGENGIQNPQQMAMAMAVEMGELLEHFAWLDADGVQRLIAGEMPNRRMKIAEEFADVLVYGVQLMRVLDVDISDAFLNKIEIVKQRAIDPNAGRTHPHVDSDAEG